MFVKSTRFKQARQLLLSLIVAVNFQSLPKLANANINRAF